MADRKNEDVLLKFEEAYARLRGEIAQVIVGQDEVIEELLIGALRRRALPARRRARPRQDAARLDRRALAEPQVHADPVHARPDAERHHRHRDPRGGSGDAAPRVPVHRGPDLREHDPRRRDQPHAAEDAGGAARGDAGAPGDGRREHLPPREAVLRARDAEPDRAGRDVSAARGAARPVHVQHQGRLSDRTTRSSGSSTRPPRASSPRRRRCSRAPISSRCSSS